MANSGYDAERPEVIVPVRLAESLGLWPKLPADVTRLTYETAGGPVEVDRIDGGAEVSIVAPDRTQGPLEADVVIDAKVRRVLLSRPLCGQLGLVLELGRGTWRFEDDPPDVHRPPQPPQYW